MPTEASCLLGVAHGFAGLSLISRITAAVNLRETANKVPWRAQERTLGRLMGDSSELGGLFNRYGYLRAAVGFFFDVWRVFVMVVFAAAQSRCNSGYQRRYHRKIECLVESFAE